MTEQSEIRDHLTTLTADIVSAHVSNNSVAAGDLPSLITNVHNALANLNSPEPTEAVPLQPAVSVRSSIKPDYLVCLEDGKKLKMLKRHLMSTYGLSPDEYRKKWNLPADYPMVAPNYAAQRKELALQFGLGRKPQAKLAPARGNRTRQKVAA
ncbi:MULTISPECIES: MucR family transcriptional regulator [Sphingobium]|jgi:predicted transcriptional regulator|uniref:Transcriptional regulator n=1 Tax=Sphingobium yanoikuyae TaxID=13690 RepID=A0A3G2USF9_SPHYA|nr:MULTISPECIES: MucR family transcriptional regulator [Sphingobium]AYO77048.1 transcriptional regulator [Sphingobium yanoikuyae]MDV3479734.1 MucR family transcriptional regulator [Sphingobium yanoikuyae]PHP20193.1 transcriptional regulator [Sphingobium sp. IP1]PZU63343.1 MAG: transcriptional regulator [Sphingobium sp.]QNG45565.1 MucR family transcriptional regulator [Sphingobium yanoikuyae]